MGEDPLPILKRWGYSLKGSEKSRKRNILIVIILVFATSLFFSVIFHPKASAEKKELVSTYDKNTLDPMNRLGQSFLEKLEEQRKDNNLCEVKLGDSFKEKLVFPMEKTYANMLAGHPMEVMAGSLAQEDKEVVAFLIGIAKKESDWGIHSPKKSGQDCFNYWGYRGTYNATDSGYSCFDSPEQAVDVVGGRIAELIAKHIDTPARMVVWKCGSTCAGHDPVAVKKWVSDVSLYYNRLES